ncbi:Ral guanine nucleotide dissociation stimulator, partial [Ophiophagus hannah]
PKVLTTPDLPITKSDSYKPSPLPPKYKETDYIVHTVPDMTHVSTEDDNYLPKVLTTPDLPITKSVSPCPVPSKFKEPGYIMPEAGNMLE